MSVLGLKLGYTDFYTSHPPFMGDSPVAIAAVGTTCIGLQYSLVRNVSR